MWSVDKNYNIKSYTNGNVDSNLNSPKSMFLHSLRTAPIFQMVNIPVNACIKAFLASVSNTLTRLLKIVAFCEYL